MEVAEYALSCEFEKEPNFHGELGLVGLHQEERWDHKTCTTSSAEEKYQV